MTKFAVVFVFAAFICATNVHVYADDGDNDKNGGGSKSQFGDWMKMQKFDDSEVHDQKFPPIKLPNVQDIYNLKPQDKNTKVSGSYSDYSSNVEMKDGKVVHQSESSKKVDNDNGKIIEENSKN